MSDDKKELPAAKQLTLEELEAKKLQEELDKLPSMEALQKEVDSLVEKKAALERLKDVRLNFGIDKVTGKDKGGKKQFDLPVMPVSLGRITISGINFQGKMKLTWTQYQEYLFHLSNRMELEEKMRFGHSVQDEQIRNFASVARGVGKNRVSIVKTGEQITF